MKGQILFWGPLDPMVDRGLRENLSKKVQFLAYLTCQSCCCDNLTYRYPGTEPETTISVADAFGLFI